MKNRRKVVLNITLIIILIFVVSSILYVKDKVNDNIYANNKVSDNKKVYAVGLPIGLYLKTKGVMIVDSGQFLDGNNTYVSPAKNKVFPGEYITEFNGFEVNNKSQLIYLINENKGKEAYLTIRKNSEKRQVKIKPVKSNKGEYLLGIWVRDDSQGIGTLTYITDENEYAALGHGISDVDTGKLLSSNNGLIYNAKIWGIKQGKRSEPGGLCGTIVYSDSNIIGTITDNSHCGIRGKIDEKIIKQYNCKKLDMASKSEIKKGKATIQIVFDNKVENYDIEIEKINYFDNEKNLVIKVTDKELLKKTNGIVQGMSGAPIIQNNKLVGAVTHVFVDDSTKGYCIFIENMLVDNP